MLLVRREGAPDSREPDAQLNWRGGCDVPTEQYILILTAPRTIEIVEKLKENTEKHLQQLGISTTYKGLIN